MLQTRALTITLTTICVDRRAISDYASAKNVAYPGA